MLNNDGIMNWDEAVRHVQREIGRWRKEFDVPDYLTDADILIHLTEQWHQVAVQLNDNHLSLNFPSRYEDPTP